jgi:hypothetical protein
MTDLEAAARDQVSLFVEGYISADELNDHLPSTWDLDAAGDDDPGFRLVMLTVGFLAEYQAGDRIEDDLRAALQPFVSWTIGRPDFSSVTGPNDLELSVRVGAGTSLRVVPA